MGDLSNPCFPVHPTTYGPPNHSGGSVNILKSRTSTWLFLKFKLGVNMVFSTNHVGDPRALSLREIGVGRLVCACSLWKETVVFGGSLLVNAHFGITHRLWPTQKWSNSIMHTGGKHLSHLSLLLFFLRDKFALGRLWCALACRFQYPFF